MISSKRYLQNIFLIMFIFLLSSLPNKLRAKNISKKSEIIFSDNFSSGSWDTWFSNEEFNNRMKPSFSVDNTIAYEQGGTSLVISGNNNSQAKGSYRKDIRKFGVNFVKDNFYKFTVWYAVKNITGINEHVFAAVTWGSVWNTQKLIPVAVESQGTFNWIKAERVVKIASNDSKVVIELTAGWLNKQSSVFYGKVIIENLPDYTPPSRKINIVTIDSSPPKGSTLLDNRDHYVKQIRKACSASPNSVDIVCLPEYFNSWGVVRNNLFDIAVDMDTSAYMKGFKDVAKECSTNIVGSVLVLENDIPFNTAFLIDRDGKVVDTQRKLHVPMQEYWWGGGRGDELKVMQADFGKIGLLVCWDYFLVDPIRTLALKGADIIFVPIEGDSRQVNGQKRKAPEYIGIASTVQNRIPMVFCFSPINVGRGNQSLMIDRDGTIKGRSNINKSIVHGEVELSKNSDDVFLNFFMDRRPTLLSGINDTSKLALWKNGSIKYVPNPTIR